MQKTILFSSGYKGDDYSLAFGAVFYESIKKTAWETPQGYAPYFDGGEIRFPVQLFHRMREAKARYVQDLLRGKFMPPVSREQLAEKLYRLSLRDGGATLFPYTALCVGRGYVVGRPEEAVQTETLGKTLLLEFLEKQSSRLLTHPYICIGTWHRQETGPWHVCLCDVFFSRQQARAVARGRGVLAYYDLAAGQSIYL